MSAPNAVGQEKDKPVLEQLLDLLLQRGQINQEQYNTLQEQARKEQSTGVQVGLDRGRPFLRAADGNVRFDVGGKLQVDFDWAEDGARTLMGTKLASQFLVRRARIEFNAQFFRWIDVTESNRISATHSRCGMPISTSSFSPSYGSGQASIKCLSASRNSPQIPI
jgi:hypothetical protein